VANTWLTGYTFCMADEPENLVLVYLRRLDEKVDALRADMTDMTSRFESIEKLVARLRVDFAHLREYFVRLEHRIDRSDARLDRIEKRLGLVDAED
jgi:predicted nuclease with TOPRIM domain